MSFKVISSLSLDYNRPFHNSLFEFTYFHQSSLRSTCLFSLLSWCCNNIRISFIFLVVIFHNNHLLSRNNNLVNYRDFSQPTFISGGIIICSNSIIHKHLFWSSSPITSHNFLKNMNFHFPFRPFLSNPLSFQKLSILIIHEYYSCCKNVWRIIFQPIVYH